MTPQSFGRTAFDTVLTIAISAAGGFAANAAGAPAGWLMGGAIAVAAAGLLGVRVTMPRPLRDATFIFTGITMGTSVARDSLVLLGQWPVTLAALVIELIILIAGIGYVLRKVFKLDTGTAYLSSFPGHLSFVMGIAAAGVGDPRQITIIQVIRILMLTVMVPIGALFLPSVGAYVPAGEYVIMSWPSLLAIIAVCAATGWLFTRLRVPAGYALGAMAAATAAKLTGLLEGHMPPLLTLATFIMIGALIGSRFAGITPREFAKASIGGLVGTAMVFIVCTVMSFLAAQLVDMPFGQIWLGLSPGGLESMGALGVALGFDTAFIAAHHVARLLLLTVAIPVVVILIRAGEKKSENQ
jgi:membrane AbrB-like protein